MQVVLKLVNFHCTNRPEDVVQFKTMYCDTSNEKSYYIIEKGIEVPVSKDEGNELYAKLRKEYPSAKAITIIDLQSDQIHYVRVNEHYEVHIGSEFHCSCQDMNEVREEMEKLKEILNKC